MPKMHQNTFGDRAPPGPAVGALALPETPYHNQWVPTSKRREGKGMEKGRREGKGEGRGRK